MRSSFAAFALLSLLAVACGGTVSNGDSGDESDAAPRADASSDAASSDAATSDAGDPTRLAAGIYGGDGVEVTVASDGSATFEFNCASGEAGPITVSNSGSTGPVFSITGTFTQKEGVALPDASSPATQPALYSGHVFGNQISFDYVVNGTTSGELSATLGQAANLAICN